jgi:DNA-3-methyladenine glycosylase
MNGTNQPLSPLFYNRSPIEVAKGLLGNLLIRQIGSDYLIGKIVETEAYLASGDPAAHNAAGKTKRTEILFGEPGRSYVYQLRHHYLLNVVTEGIDTPSCVLLRALEPLQGLEYIRLARGAKIFADTQLMNGPAKLCQAFAINLAQNGMALTSTTSPLYIAQGENDDFQIETTTRIGITKAVDELLRFIIQENPFVSNPSHRPLDTAPNKPTYQFQPKSTPRTPCNQLTINHEVHL